MRNPIRTGWRLAAAAALVAASPLALGSPASANCLATLHANPRVVQAGSTVSLSGTNYLGRNDIQIRMDRRAGPVIASIPAQPTLQGVPITIPSGTTPGIHTLLATQHNDAGDQVTCGPGRATIEVTAG